MYLDESTPCSGTVTENYVIGCIACELAASRQAEIENAYTRGFNVANRELRAPMYCGHPRACWVRKYPALDMCSPDAESQFPDDGYCICCAETERLREAAKNHMFTGDYSRFLAEIDAALAPGGKRCSPPKI